MAENFDKNSSTPESEDTTTLDERVDEITSNTYDENLELDDSKKMSNKIKGAFKKLTSSRKTKKGWISIAIIAVFLVCIVLVNIISSLLEDKFPVLSFDVTSSHSYGLQDDTIKYCKEINKKVTVYILSEEDDFVSYDSNLTAPYFTQCNTLVKEIAKQNKNISLKYINLSDNPTFTSNYTDIDWSSSDNVILVECGDKYKGLGTSDVFELTTDESSYETTVTGCKVEQGLCTALMIVQSDNLEKVTFTTGSGEQDYTTTTSLLSSNAYDTAECNLNSSEDIDSDSAIVFINAPSVDLSDDAIKKLNDFLDNDGNYGKNIIYIPYMDKVDTPNLDSFLAQWGMEVSAGYVYETDSKYMVQSGNYYVSITDFASSDYTDGLKNTSIPFLSYYSKGITITDSDIATSMLNTSTDACVRPFSSGDDWDYKDAQTGKALSVAAVGKQANQDGNTSSVTIFGSAGDFQSSVLSSTSFCNSDFLIAYCNKISSKEDMGITIESKSLDAKELGVTSYAQIIAPAIIFLGIIPIALIIVGLVIWIRRRKK